MRNQELPRGRDLERKERERERGEAHLKAAKVAPRASRRRIIALVPATKERAEQDARQREGGVGAPEHVVVRVDERVVDVEREEAVCRVRGRVQRDELRDGGPAAGRRAEVGIAPSGFRPRAHGGSEAREQRERSAPTPLEPPAASPQTRPKRPVALDALALVAEPFIRRDVGIDLAEPVGAPHEARREARREVLAAGAEAVPPSCPLWRRSGSSRTDRGACRP